MPTRQFVSRTAGVATLVATLLSCIAAPVSAQTFGRSKVQYDRFNFRILPTPHFDVYFYPAESLATADAARMAERWYERHSVLLNHTFEKNPLIFYADPPDFQQSNVVEGEIGVGTGGVTEGLRDRVIMPFTGVYADNDHVLGHELVHVFQYRMAAAAPGGINSIGQIPLWLIEGMAEYLSLGRNDANTAMWLRDAARNNDLPTIKQLTRDPRYFPYRYGQALWAYIGGKWGDGMVNQLFRAALREGWEKSLQSQLKMNADSLSKEWHAAIRTQYAPVLARTSPDSIGRGIIAVKERGDQNVSPTVSPDGRTVAFFSSRNLFGIDLYIADAASGRVIRQLTNITRNAHFDALSFINSAGSFSPDGSRIAVAVFAQGDQEINLLNVRNGRLERRISVDGIGSMSDPAWSPDGRYLAFSGLKGGISDLYVYDLQSGTSRQLTNDREAQFQPAWSPDGRTIAFVTDAGPSTTFDGLRFGESRLGLIDAAGGTVRLVPRLAYGKAINPQFTPDGNALLFVGDADGISDIYRIGLDGANPTRLTTTATGVSGITGSSPAISVARATGDVVFSVFHRGGFEIRAISGSASEARIADANADAAIAARTSSASGTLDSPPLAGVLPPALASGTAGSTTGYVERVLESTDIGLPASLPTDTRGYRPRLQLESAGNATIGGSVGGIYGAGIQGGVALGFSDMLGNNVLQTVVQVNGGLRDFGGQVQYLNRAQRLNYGVYAQHIPFTSALANYEPRTVTVDGQAVEGAVVTQALLRQYFQNVAGVVQYPLSTTRRFEFTGGVQRYSNNAEVDSLFVVGNTVVDEKRQNVGALFPAVTVGTASAAYVGDYSFFGFVSPIAGGRYRLEVAPYVGNLNYQTVLGDYRRYFFKRPITFAVRGLHYGRYGKSAEDERLQPLYVGQNYFIRGYDPADFRAEECTAGGAGGGCPEFNRLIGSRIAVANMELRIPLFGTEQLGLINLPFLPVEVSPFVDAGLAWSAGQSPKLEFNQRTTERVPVFSAGVTARVNLLGFAVVEVFYAHPFQRPDRGRVFGFQLMPGW